MWKMKNISLLLVCFFISASLALSGHIGDESESGSELELDSRIKRQIRRDRECGKHVRVDVVFLIDTSNSVSHQGFRDEIRIVVEFVKFIQQENIPFSSEDIRLAIIEYASDVEVELTFAQSQKLGKDYDGLINLVQSLQSKRLFGTTTNTAKALRVTKTYFDYNERKNARKHTIVVTDGQCSGQYTSTLPTDAEALRSGGRFTSLALAGQKERQVWGIGVGEADDDELKLISGNSYRVVHVNNYNEIQRIKQFYHEKIRKDTHCPPKLTGCRDHNGGCEHICEERRGSVQCKCRSGFTLNEDGHHCTPLCTGRHDVVIILDTSNSVTPQDFSGVLIAVEQFIRFFEQEGIEFSQEKSRLAIMQFGSEVRMDLSFDEWRHGNHHSLVKRVKKIKRLEGLVTNTAKALREAKTYFDRTARRDVQKHAIVVTDGQCTGQYVPEMNANAAALRRDNVEIFGIGVGNADENELNSISGDPKRVTMIRDYFSSQDFHNFFHFDVRDSFFACKGVRADITFVLDSSNSLRREVFANELAMVIQLIKYFEKEGIPFSPMSVRLAIIQFGSLVETDLTFDQSTSGDYASLMRRVKAIPKYEGLETNTPKALGEATTYFQQNLRSDAHKYTIVVTDGGCSGHYRPQLPGYAAALRAIGNVWSIGVGGDQFRPELIEISGNARRVLSLDYEILPENFLSTLLEEIKQRQ